MVKLIAEVGINHNGSIENAKKLIDVAVTSGCDYVKFQKRDINAVYTQAELDAPRESPWGKTNRDQKLGLEFDYDEYQQIDEYCKSVGIKWFASCWDTNSIDFIEKYFPHVPYHKVASAMATDQAFLQKLRVTGKPIILSTGMMNSEQIKKAINILGDSLSVLMHCTSTYPTKPDEMNMSYIHTMGSEAASYGYKYDIGFSNHYSGLLWVPLAIAYGAKYLEFHITLDRTLYGSDQAASLEPDGVEKLADYVRITKLMMGDGKKHVYDSELPIIKKLRKVTDF
jgi:N-acetylneuraminate synthase